MITDFQEVLDIQSHGSCHNIMYKNFLESLQRWYLSQCDGDWEHQFGIKIDTLDNPGWIVIIDLQETHLENKDFQEIDRQKNEHDWIQCEVANNKFKGAGGPHNLNEIIECFIVWVESETKKTHKLET
jgi:hypothetical protein